MDANYTETSIDILRRHASILLDAGDYEGAEVLLGAILDLRQPEPPTLPEIALV